MKMRDTQKLTEILDSEIMIQVIIWISDKNLKNREEETLKISKKQLQIPQTNKLDKRMRKDKDLT